MANMLVIKIITTMKILGTIMISMMLLVILVGETTNENMIQVATISILGSNVILCTNETKQYSPSEYVNGHSIAGYVAGRASEPGIFTISCHC